MQLKKNELLTLEIFDINMMGYGVSKIDGMVVFVQNGVPGETVRAKIIKVTSKYAVARIEEILISSSERHEPFCVAYRRCGGCVFQHVNYDLEKKVKREYVQSCFHKVGIFDVTVSEPVSDGRIERYRNKAQFPVAVTNDASVCFGFFFTEIPFGLRCERL